MQSILIPLADLGQKNVAPDEDTQNFDKSKTSKEEHHCQEKGLVCSSVY